MNSQTKRFVLGSAACLIACQLAVYVGAQAPFYGAVAIAATVYLAMRPSAALWVGFALLAIISQLYPVEINEIGTSVQGAYRPLITAVIIVASSMYVGLLLRSARVSRRPTAAYRKFRRAAAAFAALFLLALAIDYFRSQTTPGFLDVLRACSGAVTFFGFVILGLRLSPEPKDVRQDLTRLFLSILTYSAFFVTKFLFISLTLGATLAEAGYGFSQRDAVFFSGLILVILTAQVVSPAVRLNWSSVWAFLLLLLVATIFSGSRSLLGCESVVTITFLFIWLPRSRIWLSLGITSIAAILAMSIIATSAQSSVSSTDSGVLTYVSHRFLTISSEDSSLLAHESEMVAVADSLREYPLLGSGPLATYSFFDPYFGWKDTTFLDSGAGYLLMKVGILGTAVFGWLLIAWLGVERSLRKTFPRLAVALFACFLFYVVFMVFGPSFFEFQHAWFIGLVVGEAVAIQSTIPNLDLPWQQLETSA